MPTEKSTSPENPMQAFWNERFGEKEYAYGTEPNTFFRTELAKLRPGRILLPGEGEGRNAVHAAQMGWQVDALDWSESGRQKALKLAAERGVVINYQVARFDEALVRPERYDACGVVFFHLEPGLMKSAIGTMLRGLKPGGHLIAELYEKKQLQYGTGGPRSEELLYSADQLRSWVDEGGLASGSDARGAPSGLGASSKPGVPGGSGGSGVSTEPGGSGVPKVTIVSLLEQEVDLREGAYHNGRSAVLRLVAKKL